MGELRHVARLGDICHYRRKFDDVIIPVYHSRSLEPCTAIFNLESHQWDTVRKDERAPLFATKLIRYRVVHIINKLLYSSLKYTSQSGLV